MRTPARPTLNAITSTIPNSSRPSAIAPSSRINADGQGVKRARLRGKAVLICFWASWCPKSRKATDTLNALAKEHEAAPFEIVALTDEAADPVTRYVASAELSFAVGHGTESKAAYGVVDVPTAFVVGPDGAVLWKGDPLEPACAESVVNAIKIANQ